MKSQQGNKVELCRNVFGYFVWQSIALPDFVCYNISAFQRKEGLNMEKEIKDMLIAIQGSIIKLQEGQEELRKGQEELKQGQEELKQGQEELRQDVNELQEDVKVLQEDVKVLKQDVKVLKQDVRVLKQDVKDLQVRQDKYEMSQREIVYDILIPIRDNQNYINQEVRAELERIKAIIA